MTRDDIIRMAREAARSDNSRLLGCGLDDLARFAALVAAVERERVMQVVQSMKADLEAKFEKTYLEGVVAGAAAEREACAKVADKQDGDDEGDVEACIWSEAARHIAAAIRERN